MRPAVPALLAAVAVASEPPQIIVLAGQSNMDGRGATGLLSAGQKTLPAGWSFANRGQAVGLGEGEHFGPEVGFAEALAGLRPGRRFLLVKWAVGGTSMAVWTPVQDAQRAGILANDARSGHLFPRLVEATLAVAREHQAEGAKVAAILWMQGEADCRRQDWGEAYFAKQMEMIGSLRDRLAAPGAPFIFGRINPPAEAKDDDRVSPRYPGRDAVRAAQERIAKELPGTYLVETDDLSKLADRLHYDAPGQLELGRRMAAAFVTATSGSDPAAPATR